MKRKERSVAILSTAILRESSQLFLSKGYAATTIRDIFQATGLTTGSLYHFFSGKEKSSCTSCATTLPTPPRWHK
ncbi:MAG: TetR/AcrR family transcriptional regulator [Pseudomonadota bacterium]